jgi:hypothetical protein
MSKGKDQEEEHSVAFNLRIPEPLDMDAFFREVSAQLRYAMHEAVERAEAA